MRSSLARLDGNVWYPEFMTSTSPSISAPPYPLAQIRSDLWHMARTPQQWRQAMAGLVEPYDMAQFLLGSQDAGGRRTRRALLDIRHPQPSIPTEMSELLGAVSSRPNEVWGQLLKYGSQACTHPTQAWRLFAAWVHTSGPADSSRVLLATTQYTLSSSLDTLGLSTRELNKAWCALEAIGDKVNNVQWLFLLSGLDDPRLLAKQIDRSTPEQRAAAGWTALFNLQDDARICRLLDDVDLMNDPHYREFVPQAQSALEQGFENVPDDCLYDLTKRIERLGHGLDRMVGATGTWPKGELDLFVHTLLDKRKEGAKPDFPRLKSGIRRDSLKQIVQKRQTVETRARPPGKL